MNNDDKELHQSKHVPAAHKPSGAADDRLFVPKAASETDDSEGGDDGYNERLRDLDVEMQEQAENELLDEEEQSIAIQDEAGYERSRERGFDPLTHQQETHEEIEETLGHEENIDVDLPGTKRRGRKKAKLSFLNKLRLKNIANAFKKAFQQSSPKKDVASQTLESITTYKHHTINTPGNQAGIFDNTAELNAKTAKETIIQASVARQFLGQGLNILEQAQRSAEQAENKSTTPYMQNLSHSKEAVEAVSQVKDVVAKSKDILDQGVDSGKLGGIDSDVMRSLGINAINKDIKDPSRGM